LIHTTFREFVLLLSSGDELPDFITLRLVARVWFEGGTQCNTQLFCQHAVNELLVKEVNSAGAIYGRLCDVYGDVCMSASSVRRWVKHFKDGNTDIADQPRCGRPRTATTERNKQKVDELLTQDQRGNN
jgi:hypothetical protein